MSVQHVNEDDLATSEEQLPPPEPARAFPFYTYTLLTCIAAVFVTQFLTSTDPEFFSVDRFSIYYAGFDKQAFLNGHEYWRILTGATIHSGILHVALNSYALYNLGRLVELLSNRAHLAIVFIV